MLHGAKMAMTSDRFENNSNCILFPKTGYIRLQI